MAGPLDGIRIIDLTQVLAGPFATMLLADQGAEVIKVEPVAIGDLLRATKSFRKGDLTAFAANNNRGKKSLAVDLREAAGQDIVRQLTASADVFVQNFRPGVAARLGLDPDELRAANPRLITTSISGFGTTGPYSDRPVYDPIIQALTGHIAMQRTEEGDAPDLIRTVVIDKTTAMTAAQAITAALFARERSGAGQHIEMNMLDVGTSFFWPDGMMAHTFLDNDVTPGRHIGQMYTVTECADGRLVYWTASEPNLRGFYAAIGIPETIDDPDLGWPYYRSNRDRFLALTQPILAAMNVDDAVARMVENDVPCGRVLELDEVHLDPQVQHNGKVVEFQHPTAGRVRQALPAANFSATALDPSLEIPLHGSHTDELLTELGRSANDITALRRDGVVG